jgi:hypothetical protein
MLILLSGAANAATVVNQDAQAYTLVVTEGGQKSEVGLAAGQTIDVCGGGCFITMPNGDREALAGGETVEIKGGVATIK